MHRLLSLTVESQDTLRVGETEASLARPLWESRAPPTDSGGPQVIKEGTLPSGAQLRAETHMEMSLLVPLGTCAFTASTHVWGPVQGQVSKSKVTQRPPNTGSERDTKGALWLYFHAQLSLRYFFYNKITTPVLDNHQTFSLYSNSRKIGL